MLTTAFTRVVVATAATVALAATASSVGAQSTPAAAGTPPAVKETGAIPKESGTSGSAHADAVANAATPAAPAGTAPAAAAPATPATPAATTPATPPSTDPKAAATPAGTPAAPAAAAPDAATATPPSTDPAAAATPAVTTPPPPPSDPVVVAVRTWLGTAANTSSAHKDDVAAATAFYGMRTEPPLWVEKSGFTAKAKSAIEEVNKADDWGLSADAFALPRFNVSTPSTEALAEAEARLTLELLKYVRHAKGGRLNLASLSRILDLTPPVKDPAIVIGELAAASAPDAYLRDQHPKHSQFKLLHKALLKARGPAQAAVEIDPALKVSLPATREMLKGGVEHPNVALLRQRMKVPAEAGAKETLFDEKLALALRAFQAEKGLAESGELTGATRKALNREVDALRAPDPERGTQLLVLNMERWRWMPENLGRVYVWNNIPEYTTRVIKGDEVLFRERIIVGLPNWATPVFSETMKTIVFNPSWGMPDGIKQRELAPRLRSAGGGDFFSQLFGGGGGGAAIRAHGLKVYYGGREINPDSVNWSTADLRAYSFIQPPGGKNPLGQVKFMFPNRHDVYMHDTIERSLFQQPNRALSHGCIRVQDPMKFARIMLAEGNGLDARGVEQAIAGGGDVKLKDPIPVHNAYFTAVADADGHVSTFGDLYGHDSRLSAALTGRSIRFDPGVEAVAAGEEAAPVRTKEQARVKKKTKSAPDTLADAISGFWLN
ncbi:L,D-transpeptidase family protein [Hyphomicrobium sp.]|uniref:L,D-transpeptidase family protein n=1 Tax=Hyphomicrobium sp. TaxID=82 RepID=UPI0025BE4EF6|nr:L,D-transpeptidase family protein [Hyphomicrobium sp.]MCC7251422.1 L,D-transpeptidase family protein [Hyphomicrobium sp.]